MNVENRVARSMGDSEPTITKPFHSLMLRKHDHYLSKPPNPAPIITIEFSNSMTNKMAQTYIRYEQIGMARKVNICF